LESVIGLLLWKYFEMTLISFFDLARREGGDRTFSMVIRIGFAISLLFLLGFSATLEVNLEEIFALKVVICCQCRESPT